MKIPYLSNTREYGWLPPSFSETFLLENSKQPMFVVKVPLLSRVPRFWEYKGIRVAVYEVPSRMYVLRSKSDANLGLIHVARSGL